MSDATPTEFDAIEREAMAGALAASLRGSPSPNPPVGAAVVRDGEVVAFGHHRRAGEDHAEVVALRGAGERARAATLFVTLEPCNHVGRTAPCTEAILRAGVRRVVFAVRDPNPNVAGHGARALAAAGVEVREGFGGALQREAERVLAPWGRFITLGRAHVTLKAGLSLDGAMATRGGESQWITSEETRRDAHALRGGCDAVIAGIGTVRADDPLLTVRGVDAPRRPVRVILSTGAELPLGSRLVATARDVPVWLLCGEGGDAAQREREAALAAAGVDVLRLPRRDGRVDLASALRALGSRGVVSALAEGGSAVHGALVDAGLADRVVLYLAPMLLGGGGLRAIGGAGPERLAEALRLGPLDVRRVGPDLRVEAEVR